jgi:valyl-tRNA synthetase
METGHDILFFWVARMAQMGLLLTGKLPFNKCYLHSIIRDEKGEKMSKSKGNIIDPMEVINGCTIDELVKKIQDSTLAQKEKDKSIAAKKKHLPAGIAQCGSDALRFGILNLAKLGKDLNLDLNMLIVLRQFCNKIWNSYKYTMEKIGDYVWDTKDIKLENMSLIDKWILTKLNDCVKGINGFFDSYHYSEATECFKQFWTDNFCDIYLEHSKLVIIEGGHDGRVKCTKAILFKIIETGLRLLHPMMPFMTEELYQKLPAFEGKAKTVSLAAYPADNLADSFPESSQFDVTLEILTTVRQLKGGVTLPPKTFPKIFLTTEEAGVNQTLIAEFLPFVQN